MRVSTIVCDRCGKGPLQAERVGTLSLSPDLAKRVKSAAFVENRQHMADLCPPCQEDFCRFMERKLG